MGSPLGSVSFQPTPRCSGLSADLRAPPLPPPVPPEARAPCTGAKTPEGEVTRDWPSQGSVRHKFPSLVYRPQSNHSPAKPQVLTGPRQLHSEDCPPTPGFASPPTPKPRGGGGPKDPLLGLPFSHLGKTWGIGDR